jgi:hypothetical protein
MSRVRAAFVGLLALLAIGQVVRTAYVAAYAKSDPAKAAALWPSHPDVLFNLALGDIAQAAAAGQPVPKDRIEAIYEASARSPLAPEPFLVRGVDAQVAGDQRLAGRAFEAARERDPHSLAAHYFLADHYLRTNQPDAGLAELATLTRLVPNGIASVAPYYAAYAKSPGGAARVKAMLRREPEFEAEVMAVLAQDASNADLVLALANQPGHSAGDPPVWHGKLVESLVAAGQYRKARAVWARLSGLQGGSEQGLFDPEFTGSKAPPPFNWTLLSNASGLAEGQGDGRLHVIYYGRDNAALVSQTLTLGPGQYRLGFQIDGGSTRPSSLAWKLTCLPSKQVAITIPLSAPGKPAAADFNVGNSCPAQRLELSGSPPDFPQTVDVTISELSLAKVSS